MFQAKYVTILAVIAFGIVKYVTVPDTMVIALEVPEVTSSATVVAVAPADIEEPKYVPIPAVVTEQDLECLAQNIYFEAKNQSLKGQMAVGIVTLKRVESRRFPDTVCDVVKQTHHFYANGLPVKHKCHFSWYCDGKADQPVEKRAYQRAINIAGALLTKESALPDFTNGADHYHADYIDPPVWTSEMVKVGQIDNHIFYTTTL